MCVLLGVLLTGDWDKDFILLISNVYDDILIVAFSGGGIPTRGYEVCLRWQNLYKNKNKNMALSAEQWNDLYIRHTKRKIFQFT